MFAFLPANLRARVSMFVAVLLCAGCSSVPLSKPNGELFKIESTGTNQSTDLVNEFQTERQTAAAANGIAPAAFIESGITLSNAYCNQYLDSLNAADQQTGVYREAFNILGAGAIAIAGLNGSSGESLGKAGAALVAGNALFDNYRTNLLLAPANAITEKLKEYREVQANLVRGQTDVTYERAVGLLLEYHDSCSPKAIRQLVASSLQQVAYKAPAPTDALSPTSRAEADQLRASLSRTLGTTDGSLSEPLLYQLYTVVVLKGSPADREDVIKSFEALPSVRALNDKVVALQKSNPADHTQFVINLQRLADLLGFDGRLSRDIAAKQLEVQAADYEKNAAAAGISAEQQKALNNVAQQKRAQVETLRNPERMSITPAIVPRQ